MTTNEAPQPSVAITGAGSGLGRELALKLADKGYRVFGTALNPAEVDDLATASGGRVALSVADITDETAVADWVEKVTNQLGARGLDVLISNAGVLAPNGRIHNLATADWERSYRVNVLGPVNGIRAAVPVMRAQRSGSIILTASVAGMTAWSHSSPYCVTKAGVIQLAKVAAVEYARDGIRVNCVCPGTFLSGMHTALPAEAVDAIAAKHPLGLGTAGDLVGAYSYLASDASRWTTGSAIVVDGGYAAP